MRLKKGKVFNNLLILEDVVGDVGKHSGVDDQEDEDRKVKPQELVHSSKEVAAPQKEE